MERIVMIGGMPIKVDDKYGNFIFTDSSDFSKYGWISENFDGYLTLKEDQNEKVIWISVIISKHEGQGNFIKLLTRLLIDGYSIFIPTPSVRMAKICNKYGGFSVSQYEDVKGLHHSKAGKVYTSYYANIKNLEGKLLLKISNSAPPIEGLHNYHSLIPDWEHIVKPFKDGEFNEEIYNFKYWTQIKDKLPQVSKTLKNLCTRSGKDVVLLCYEAPDKFCHRHLAAEWLSPHLGYEVKELDI